MSEDFDTIAAVATAPGVGAIAIVRVSGSDTLKIASRLSRCPAEMFVPRVARLFPIYSGRYGELDRGVYTFFQAPSSYTGEDVLELSCHGGIASSRSVLRAVFDLGARPAEPGEFTKRAFVNGKLDLTQAEAINNFIRARTQTQLSAARQTMEGAFSRRLKMVASRLTQLAAGLEASIDFPEEVDEPDRESLAQDLESEAAEMDSTLSLAERGRLLQAGIRLAIVGHPNAGKSSLLNLLSGRDRAIVSEIPGTTRDYLEEMVEIAGLPVVAVDTAGIRETDDPIEKEGTRRAMDALVQADVGLIVLDSTREPENSELELIRQVSDRAVVVWNKIDLLKSHSAFPGISLQGVRQVRISALTGEGLDELETSILETVGVGRGYFDEAISANERQIAALKQSTELIRSAAQSARLPLALDLAAVQIQSARNKLGEITGENAFEGMIDAIFSSFCIGK